MSTSQATFAFVQTLASELSHQEFDIPPFPDVAIRIRDAMNNPNVTTHDIAKIITADPVLTTRLLRMANSALLRRGPIEITDINVAIGRLGFDLVRNTVVSLAMDTTFAAGNVNAEVRKYIDAVRTHSTHVCALAYILAKRQSGMNNWTICWRPGIPVSAGRLSNPGASRYTLPRPSTNTRPSRAISRARSI